MLPWYASWFDSPFYPMLYKHRDEQEAAEFLDRLLIRINLPKGSRILDLACGRGRHSRFLHARGMHVHGVDLSPSSIAEAERLASDGLSFEVRDMRVPFVRPEFDLALSLFTSFGYFDSDQENKRVLEALRSSVRHSGYVVLDFFNGQKVIADLKEAEQDEKQIGAFWFFVKKSVENGSIVKEIRVKNAEQEWVFTECVRAYAQHDLVELSRQAGLEMIESFGSYLLEAFDAKTSDRCILLMKPIL